MNFFTFFTFNRWSVLATAIMAPLVALMPWNTGPYWLDATAIFICTIIVQLLVVGLQKFFNYCYKRWFQPK